MTTRHKGALSDAALDREWPHQVAIQDDLCVDRNFQIIADWLIGRSHAPRTRTVTVEWRNSHKVETYRVHCFSNPADAVDFLSTFGGYRFDTKVNRGGQGRRHGGWLREDVYVRFLASGPLRVPDILTK